MKENNSPIIIIGMHRSGTSMLTRFLEESGLFMGINKNMGPNQEAFFFQKLNEWILYQKGVTWDNTYNLKFESAFTNNNITRTVQKRINSFFVREYLGNKNFLKYRKLQNIDIPWGWKDPKNTLTLDIWKNIYPTAKIIHIYRNPIDVAASLKSREHRIEKNYAKCKGLNKKEFFLLKRPCYNQSVRIKNLEEGFNLWKDYTELALDADKNFKEVIHISYENFLENPESILVELSEFLGFEIIEKKITSIKNKIDCSRKYSFLNDKELMSVYSDVKNMDIMKKLNYSNIAL